MDHFQQIYANRAAEYHRMIAAEDVDGQIVTAIRSLTVLEHKRLLDLGTGTGRIPLLLARDKVELVGVDLHASMLKEQKTQRDQIGGRWPLIQGDLRNLPFTAAVADITTAGWAIGHMRAWFPRDWKEQIGAALQEMHRVTVPGGQIILFETLGTGSLTPQPPNQDLADYYYWLETEWSFERQTFATDYTFANPEEAVQFTEFFFGPELSDKIRTHAWSRLPEWTGMWINNV